MDNMLYFFVDKKGRGVFTISLWLRLLYVCAAFFICTTFLILLVEKNANIVHGAIAILSLVAALYREFWIFSPSDRNITFSRGLGFFLKKTVFPVNKNSRLVFVELKRSPSSSKIYQSRFSIFLNGKQTIIDCVKPRNSARLKKSAEKVCLIIGMKLETETI